MELSIKDLSFSYKDGDNVKEIFDNVNIEFNEKKFYCITGPSGSGKTTLLSLIGTIDNIKQGHIFLDGQDIFKDVTNYRKNKVGLVFQNYNLINYLNAIENVRLAMDIAGRKEDLGRILGTLDLVGIKEDTAKRKVNKLSGGEQQRIAIARALINNPDIILADEPTGNLDEETSNNIVDIFIKLAHEYDKCVIMVTHNKDIAKRCDIEYSIVNKNIDKHVNWFKLKVILCDIYLIR